LSSVKGHAPKASDCRLCKDNKGKVILPMIALNHPNRRDSLGRTFNQEIAAAIGRSMHNRYNMHYRFGR
jgi:hypothetical protein